MLKMDKEFLECHKKLRCSVSYGKTKVKKNSLKSSWEIFSNLFDTLKNYSNKPGKNFYSLKSLKLSD